MQTPQKSTLLLDKPSFVILVLLVVVDLACRGICVGETWMEGRTVWHCEILEGMSERVGLGEGLDGKIMWW